MPTTISNFVRVTTLALTITTILAFSAVPQKHVTLDTTKCLSDKEEIPLQTENPTTVTSINSEAISIPNRAFKDKSPAHKDGIFSPLVIAAKNVMGENELKKFRANIISKHSSVIKKFVDTYDSSFGQAVASQLFNMMDNNNDGRVDKEELKGGLHFVGFSWMEEKQVDSIVKRADSNKDGVLEFDEFIHEIPKTLKTNLLKLAKKNGNDMGLLV